MSIRKYRRGGAIAVVAVALVGGYAAGHRNVDASELPSHDQLPAPAGPVQSGASGTAAPDFSRIVTAYGAAVVHIGAQRTADVDDGDGEHHGGDSLGSGFIISKDGYILTNNHVVDGADSVTVKLSDGRRFQATVIGTDKTFDVAVLKVDADNLPTVKIGNPSKSKVGEWVVAIGSPYGLDNTVTSGIISAKARTLSDGGPTRFIQTDVPVNPGNSGGPLFNLDGEVIGINSMIYSRTGGFQGLSFAIPIDQAMRVKDRLVAHGDVGQGRIGVSVQEISPDIAQSLGLDSPKGALVGAVDAHGPAAASGLRPGDVIVGVNGADVADPMDLVSQVTQLTPGSSATIDVWRDGAARKLTVVVGSQSDSASQAQVRPHDRHQPRLGVAVRPLNENEQLDDAPGAGVFVEQSTGSAAAAGIHAGDIIVAVNGTTVTGVEQLRQLVQMAAKTGGRMSVTVNREGATMSVPVTLG
ncbi:Do family serine endopeptidase [Paraburkholderia humisilvae]|uniref:Probable periplasmic serine endoprotease DegP-like n=1 Tax=Paraburkholderia humisilvae TaxID=627669 RepID=A0A6J5EF78_9BURK|nr:Do family serine endopeptidase [Paraburkholderia humisilvae]CAB3764407.1 hypothetical protein LMG29542_04887 [Paraburkholderia humisilvae]